jgi:hypothetical protein
LSFSANCRYSDFRRFPTRRLSRGLRLLWCARRHICAPVLFHAAFSSSLPSRRAERCVPSFAPRPSREGGSWGPFFSEGKVAYEPSRAMLRSYLHGMVSHLRLGHRAAHSASSSSRMRAMSRCESQARICSTVQSALSNPAGRVGIDLTGERR